MTENKEKSVTREQIVIVVNELYESEFFVATEAGIRLTYPFLRYYMKNPQKALQKVIDYFIGSSNSSSSNITTLAKDIVENVCYLLVGTKIRKWVSFPELYQALRNKGYTITTIDAQKKVVVEDALEKEHPEYKEFVEKHKKKKEASHRQKMKGSDVRTETQKEIENWGKI